MTGADIPVLPRGVRTHFDRVRGVPVLLGPERVLMLDEIGQAVLDKVDGTRPVDQIAAELAEAYGAPLDQVRGDVIEYLDDLAAKRLLDRADG